MLEVLNFQCYLSLLLAIIKMLSCFFRFFVVLINFLIILVVREKNKAKLAIPTGAPTILVNEMIDTPPVIAPKSVKNLVYVIKNGNIFT